MWDVGQQRGNQPGDHEAESRLIDVQEAAQPVDRAATGRFREGCRERRPAEQDGRAVDDLPAGGIEDDTPTRLTPEIERHGVVPSDGDPQADVLCSGVIGLALEHGEGVVERRAARHHGLRGVEDPGEVLAQRVPPAQREGDARTITQRRVAPAVVAPQEPVSVVGEPHEAGRLRVPTAVPPIRPGQDVVRGQRVREVGLVGAGIAPVIAHDFAPSMSAARRSRPRPAVRRNLALIADRTVAETPAGCLAAGDAPGLGTTPPRPGCDRGGRRRRVARGSTPARLRAALRVPGGRGEHTVDLAVEGGCAVLVGLGDRPRAGRGVPGRGRRRSKRECQPGWQGNRWPIVDHHVAAGSEFGPRRHDVSAERPSVDLPPTRPPCSAARCRRAR